MRREALNLAGTVAAVDAFARSLDGHSVDNFLVDEIHRASILSRLPIPADDLAYAGVDPAGHGGCPFGEESLVERCPDPPGSLPGRAAVLASVLAQSAVARRVRPLVAPATAFFAAVGLSPALRLMPP